MELTDATLGSPIFKSEREVLWTTKNVIALAETKTKFCCFKSDNGTEYNTPVWSLDILSKIVPLSMLS